MLDINIKYLNDFFKDDPITFKYNGNIIQIIEHQKYYLNDHNHIKQKLKNSFHASFSGEFGWHFDRRGVEFLKNRLIKLKCPLSPDHLKRKLSSYYRQISNKDLLQGLKTVLDKNPRFFTSRASRSRHHSYEYGLFEHSLQVTEFALAIYNTSEIAPYLDKDLIIIGSLLHDIGKIDSYDMIRDDPSPSQYMLEQGHLLHGSILVERYFKGSGITEEFKNKLFHIIASHHLQINWDAIKEPITNEAYIVAFADNISAKLG